MEQKPHVSIPSWEIEDQHVVFNISTIPGEGETFTTKRRYREFERLNRKLESKSLPRLNLPGKLFVHSDSAIESRRVKLERVLRLYVQAQGIDPILEEFLSPRFGVGLLGSRQSSMQDSVIDTNSVTPQEGEVEDEEEEEEETNVAQNNSEEEDSNSKNGPHLVWSLEMLAARAAYRAERCASIRLARVYSLATIITLVASLSSRAHRWPLLGAAFGSGVSAAFAMLTALWTIRKEDWRRRGFGLTTSPSSCSDGTDARTLADSLSARGENKKSRKVSSDKQQIEATEKSDVHTQVIAVQSPSLQTVTLENDELFKKLDELHLLGLYEESLRMIQTVGQTLDPNILWRSARAAYYRSMTTPDESDMVRLESILKKLMESAKVTTSSLTHKWIAIVHNAYAVRKGSISDRVEAGLSFERNAKRALELDPSDPTLHYLLGRFCFDVAGLTWLERKGAKAVSGKEPPKTTYQEALQHFENALALKASPSFQVERGRCYQKLKDERKALECFKAAAQFVPATAADVLTPEENAAIEEAKTIVRSMT